MEELLGFYTTAEKTAEGKTRILVCFHEEEEHLFKDVAQAELREYCDSTALFYPVEPKKIASQRELRDRVMVMTAEMDGLFVCVTKKLLETPYNIAKDIIIAGRRAGKVILPYFCEPDLFDAWNSFLEIQAIDPFNTDPTQISYHTKIANWVEKITPLSEDVVEKIWNSYNDRIFLSYRKSDRKYINPLMHAIHGDARKNPLSLVGIWYDEALTSDENFNNIIAKNIEESSLYLMLVTSNTFKKNAKGEDNYVISTEYPAFVESGKPIVGVLTYDVDISLAVATFPEVRAWVSYDDDESIINAILNNIVLIPNFGGKTSENLYYLGLGYYKGIGAENYIDNAVFFFMNAMNKDNHLEATRRLVEICFDENEKAKGDEGFYDISSGVKFQSEIAKKACDDNDGSNDGIKRAVDENLKLYKYLSDTGEVKNLEISAMHLTGFIPLINKSLIKPEVSCDREYIDSLVGETLIMLGEVQYLRHLYKHKDMYGREEGCIDYLREGIGKMLKRAEYPDFSLKDIYRIADAYDYLGDAYYRTAQFSRQRECLINKLKLIEDHALNEMDRAQLLERADTYGLLGEADLMCDRKYLEEALEAYRKKEDILGRAEAIYYDAQIFIRAVKHYNALGNAYLCKMDIMQGTGKGREYLDYGLEYLERARKTCVSAMEESTGIVDDKTLKYLLGVTQLHIYQVTKNSKKNTELIGEAFENLRDSVTDKNDYDALHYLYRAYLEMGALETTNMRYRGQVNAQNINYILNLINESITEIDKDPRKRKDYWINLDLIELCVVKANILIEAILAGALDQSYTRDIEMVLNAALTYGERAYKAEGADKSKVLLGALSLTCEVYRYFYFKCGDEENADRMQAMRNRYNRESLASTLNDYMR